VYRIPVIQYFINGKSGLSDFIGKQQSPNEELLLNWVNDPKNSSKILNLFTTFKEPLHVAWYLLNVNPCRELTEAFNGQSGKTLGVNTLGKIEVFNLRVLDTYLPLLLLNQDDWRDRINKLKTNIEAFDGVIRHLEKALRSEPALELQCRLSIESIKLIQSISGERLSPLLINATGSSSSQFIQYIHDLIPRVESGFKRRNDLVILIATLLSSAVTLKQAVNNQPCDEALNNLMQNTEALINFHENQPEWVIKHLHDAIYKYQCIYQKLMDEEIKNYSLLFGLEPPSAESHDLMHYQYGFANEKIGTLNVERAFDINAFKSAEIFQAGLNETYVAKFAYRTERKHWQEALDKLSSTKEPMSKKGSQDNHLFA